MGSVIPQLSNRWTLKPVWAKDENKPVGAEPGGPEGILEIGEPFSFVGPTKLLFTQPIGVGNRIQNFVSKLEMKPPGVSTLVEQMGQEVRQAEAMPLNYRHEYVEELLYPWLFFEGHGGYNSTYSKHRDLSTYLRMQLLNGDPRWRRDVFYPYYGFELSRRRIIDSYNKYLSTHITRKDAQNTDAGAIQDAKETVYDRRPKLVPDMMGSHKYWQQAYFKLHAAINNVGRPDLFVTFTLNDQDADLKAFLTHMHGTSSVRPQEDPVLTALFFKHKYRLLVRLLVGQLRKNYEPDAHEKRKSNPFHGRGMFGYAKLVFWRFEYQNRGAPHIHAILRLEEEDRKRVHDQCVVQAVMPDASMGNVSLNHGEF